MYSSCCDRRRGIYYYTAYGNRRITGVDMRSADPDSSELALFPLREGQDVLMEAMRCRT